MKIQKHIFLGQMIGWTHPCFSRRCQSPAFLSNISKDRIRCYKCMEYNHFVKECPTLQAEKESQQLQQMYYMDKEQTALKVLAMDTYDSLNRINSVDETMVDHLNL